MTNGTIVFLVGIVLLVAAVFFMAIFIVAAKYKKRVLDEHLKKWY